MAFTWPKDLEFTPWDLDVIERDCPSCGRMMHICDHRQRRLYTLDGPVELICKLNHCPDPNCPAHVHTLSPLAEAQFTLPWWLIGWDVFCWMGHRRFARHWSIPQLQAELRDGFHIPLSDDAISASLRRYQTMVAARHQDAAVLAELYRGRKSLILTIDGLQPEKGHETLYVVRELGAKRIWFAEALLSSAAGEVQRLIAKAKQWADQIGLPVQLWMSDKQEAFVKGIAFEFPGVPHRYCQNHFLRDVAKPVLEEDSHAKVKMRKKVRGLRAIEQDVLAQRRDEAEVEPPAVSEPESIEADTASPVAPDPRVQQQANARREDARDNAASAALPRTDDAGEVVLAYCACVRGILNDAQGGPLHPPGLRMAEALGEVRESLQRNLDAKKGGARRNN